jgi:hypothetical protein
LLRTALVVFSAGLGVLPLTFDRLLAPRLRGTLRALVFPLAAVTIEYLVPRHNRADPVPIDRPRSTAN